jgi:hypothetical protein
VSSPHTHLALLSALLLTGCVPDPPSAPSAPPPPPRAAAAARACAAPEHRQFDFWIGDWDVTIRARKGPDSDAWGEAKGTNHVEAVLGGCAIAEHFEASGPGDPWAGRSYSLYSAAEKKWRQTWVDDQGSYLAFTGGMEGSSMILHGEPRVRDGKTFRMRMVFSEITPGSLAWSWERTADEGKTWTPMMQIRYVRRR